MLCTLSVEPSPSGNSEWLATEVSPKSHTPLFHFVSFKEKAGEDTLKGYANSSVLDILALGPPRNLLPRYPLSYT